MRYADLLIGQNVSLHRRLKNISRESLAKFLKCDPKDILLYEKGIRELPMDFYYNIVSAFDITPAHLVKCEEIDHELIKIDDDLQKKSKKHL